MCCVYPVGKCSNATVEENLFPKFNIVFHFAFQEDLYYPHPLMQDMLWGFLHHFVEPVVKRWPFSKLRDRALEIAMEHVHYEDENSRYLCIGCVEKVTFLSNALFSFCRPFIFNLE